MVIDYKYVHVCMYVRTYVCMCVRMYVCMYVRMYVIQRQHRMHKNNRPGGPNRTKRYSKQKAKLNMYNGRKKFLNSRVCATPPLSIVENSVYVHVCMYMYVRIYVKYCQRSRLRRCEGSCPTRTTSQQFIDPAMPLLMLCLVLILPFLWTDCFTRHLDCMCAPCNFIMSINVAKSSVLYSVVRTLF